MMKFKLFIIILTLILLLSPLYASADTSICGAPDLGLTCKELMGFINGDTFGDPLMAESVEKIKSMHESKAPTIDPWFKDKVFQIRIYDPVSGHFNNHHLGDRKYVIISVYDNYFILREYSTKKVFVVPVDKMMLVEVAK